jgi:small subunit ribosomal protein S6
MRTYELLYIIPATLTDEEVAQTESDIIALIQKYGGEPKESRRLGKYKFAYLIQKIRHGYYVMVYFDTEPENVAKINEALRIHERVVRHLILSKEEAGGEEFNLVQFQEVVVDGSSKDDKSKRKKFEKKNESTSQDVQAAAELDKTDDDEKNAENSEVEENVKEVEKIEEASEDVLSGLSADELDKKIDAALSEEAK